MQKQHSLRIISGNYKGRAIMSPASSLTHPMGARERLALFNMVNPAGKKVLDAFAGSGALGIEALSRGAETVVFVERSRAACRLIRENLAGLGAENFRIVPQEVADFVGEADFDLILADPPYDEIDLAELQGLSELLAADGELVLSSPATQEAPNLQGLKERSSHTYAGARLTVYDRSKN